MRDRSTPRAAPSPATRHGSGHDALIGLAGGLAVTLVAAAAALLFALAPDDAPDDTVLRVVAIHELPAPDPPPEPPLPAPSAPARSFDQRAARAGWVPVGAREDEIEGRDARTTAWSRGGRRISHTVLEGEPAPPPADARRTGRGGVLLHSVEVGGRTVVSWTANGRTEVVSSAGVPRAVLYALAGGPPDG